MLLILLKISLIIFVYISPSIFLILFLFLLFLPSILTTDVATSFNGLLPLARLRLTTKTLKFNWRDPFTLRGTVDTFGTTFSPRLLARRTVGWGVFSFLARNCLCAKALRTRPVKASYMPSMIWKYIGRIHVNEAR